MGFLRVGEAGLKPLSSGLDLYKDEEEWFSSKIDDDAESYMQKKNHKYDEDIQ